VEIPAIKNYGEDLSKMKLLNPHKDGRLALMLEGIQQLKDLPGGQYPVLGYVNDSFSTPAEIVEQAKASIENGKGKKRQFCAVFRMYEFSGGAAKKYKGYGECCP
jgi:hypothetical protein